jgi:hypothetical protein
MKAWSRSRGRFQGWSLAQNRMTVSPSEAPQDLRTASRSTLADLANHPLPFSRASRKWLRQGQMDAIL